MAACGQSLRALRKCNVGPAHTTTLYTLILLRYSTSVAGVNRTVALRQGEICCCSGELRIWAGDWIDEKKNELMLLPAPLPHGLHAGNLPALPN